MDLTSVSRSIVLGACSIYWHQDIRKHINYLESSQWLSAKDIQRTQWIKLKKLLDYVYVNVPYYRKMFNELNLEPKDIQTPDDYCNLYLLDKNAIQNNINDIISSNYRKSDLIKNSTGGSTGINLIFYNDKTRAAYNRAMVFRNNGWAGFHIGDKNAELWGSPMDINIHSVLKYKAYRYLTGSLFLPSYDLSKDNVLYNIKKLVKHNPKIIVGYASALYSYAEYLDKYGINEVVPKSIISSAEILYDYQRELIESTFHSKVFNRYGCREFSTIAQECSEHSGFHINAEHVYVECLNDNGMPADVGERGEIVITDLDNYAMPFIRYKIGDIGILSNRVCNCGRGLPILEHLEGRSFDIIIGKDGKYFDGHFFPLVLRTVDGILQYQLIQEKIDELTIKIVIDRSFNKIYLDVLTNKIINLMGKETKVNFEIVDQIEPSVSGKRRFIISNINRNGSFCDSLENDT